MLVVLNLMCGRAALLLGGDGNDDVEGGMICVIVTPMIYLQFSLERTCYNLEILGLLY